MPDIAHQWTDEQIELLQKEFGKVYRQASREMRVKLGKHMAEFDKKNSEWKKRVKDDPYLEGQYKDWLKAQASRKKWIKSMSTALTEDAVKADQLASEHIRDAIPTVFAENANRAAYGIQEGLGRQINQFALVDMDTVRNLVANRPNLLPNVALDEKKDTAWNQQKITASITQSILQGESIPNASKRLMQVVGMDANTAIRSARTAITGAENAGRVHSYQRAKELGIDLEQQWIAAIDNRTRTEHRLLDGEHVPVGESFHVPGYGGKYDIRYPGDPTALPEMVYNCRCTLVAYLNDVKDPERWSRLPEGTTYDDWKGQKEKESATAESTKNIVVESIAGAVKGEPMDFDRANSLRGNPNYNIAGDAENAYKEAYYAYNNALLSGFKGLSGNQINELIKAKDDAYAAYKKAMKAQEGYRVNCQTCVVANEARRRGYMVQATPKFKGSVNEEVSYNTRIAWIDKTTGEHPDYIKYSGPGELAADGVTIPTYKQYINWLESDGIVEEGARYTIEFSWSGKSRSGHIVCLERVDGVLRLYDPQSGFICHGEDVHAYLKKVKFKTTYRRRKFDQSPKLLKVSDYDFDTDICNQILTKADE